MLQVFLEHICGPEEWWRYLLHELCLPAALHAAIYTQDATGCARVCRRSVRERLLPNAGLPYFGLW